MTTMNDPMTAHDHKAVSEAEHALRWLTAFDLRAGKHADVIRAELEKLRQRCEVLESLAKRVAGAPVFDMHLIHDSGSGECVAAQFGTRSDPGKRVALVEIVGGEEGSGG
jgi:hypothetical protein